MEVQQQISCGSLEAPLAGKLACVVVFNGKLFVFRRDGFCASKVWRPVGRQCIIVKLVRFSTTLSMSHNFFLIITTIFAGVIAFSMQGQFSLLQGDTVSYSLYSTIIQTRSASLVSKPFWETAAAVAALPTVLCATKYHQIIMQRQQPATEIQMLTNK